MPSVPETLGIVSAKLAIPYEKIVTWYKNYNVHVEGKENIPEGPCLFASTHFAAHPNDLLPRDSLAILKLCNEENRKLLAIRRINPTPKSFATGVPIIEYRKGLMDANPNILAVRTDTPLGGIRKILKVGKEQVEQGGSLLIFPWGQTFPRYNWREEIYPGFAYIAHKLNIPVVPTYFVGSTERSRGDLIYLGFGKPFNVPDKDQSSRENAVARLRSNWIGMEQGYRTYRTPQRNEDPLMEI